jgi:hypothetical protein
MKTTPHHFQFLHRFPEYLPVVVETSGTPAATKLPDQWQPSEFCVDQLTADKRAAKRKA